MYYYRCYEEMLRDAPDTPGKRLAIRIVEGPRPDFTNLEKEVREFERQIVEKHRVERQSRREYGNGQLQGAV
jgi:hypothetical protein